MGTAFPRVLPRNDPWDDGKEIGMGKGGKVRERKKKDRRGEEGGKRGTAAIS